jgi:adenylyltransferase/sulfurtransferase
VPTDRRPLVEPVGDLTVDEARRYARHLALPEVGIDGQRRLRAASVLVLGAGGLGSPVLTYLAAAGVGRLAVVDDDCVDLTNLQRQVVHGSDDVGRLKVDSAADAVAAINPGVEVLRHHARLDADNALDLLRGHDLVLDCADNFATRYLINDACEILGKPYVWGAIQALHGQVTTFWAAPPVGGGVTYRDVFPEPPPSGTVPSCAEGGVLGALCGAVGSMMAVEAIKLITGIGEWLLGRLLIVDVAAARWDEVPVMADPRRSPVTALTRIEPTCALPPVMVGEIDPVGLARRLGSPDTAPVLLDVREADEHAAMAISDSIHVPLAQLDPVELAGRLGARDVVVYCRSGVRSAAAAGALAAAGLSVSHLAGGILAWVAGGQPVQGVQAGREAPAIIAR